MSIIEEDLKPFTLIEFVDTGLQIKARVIQPLKGIYWVTLYPLPVKKPTNLQEQREILNECPPTVLYNFTEEQCEEFLENILMKEALKDSEYIGHHYSNIIFSLEDFMKKHKIEITRQTREPSWEDGLPFRDHFIEYHWYPEDNEWQEGFSSNNLKKTIRVLSWGRVPLDTTIQEKL